jgi:hypothetical protein
VAGVAFLGLAAGVMLVVTVATANAQREAKPPDTFAVFELTQRCQVEMLRGTGAAMQASLSTPAWARSMGPSLPPCAALATPCAARWNSPAAPTG